MLNVLKFYVILSWRLENLPFQPLVQQIMLKQHYNTDFKSSIETSTCWYSWNQGLQSSVDNKMTARYYWIVMLDFIWRPHPLVILFLITFVDLGCLVSLDCTYRTLASCFCFSQQYKEAGIILEAGCFLQEVSCSWHLILDLIYLIWKCWNWILLWGFII